MNRTSKERVALLRAIAVLGVAGAACLTRPVETWKPNLKTSFTNIIKSSSVNKLDLLFMVDNSASMGDKQALLADAIPDMINRLVSPNCVDTKGATVGVSSAGVCTVGKIEFPPVHDMHLGIVTSSLGGRVAADDPANACPPGMSNGLASNLNGHNDDQGHLINRMLSGPAQMAGTTEIPIPKAGSPSENFLAWYPSVQANMNSADNPPPPANHTPEVLAGDKATAGTLIGDFALMIQGVQEHGCGFEAQNEAWYRFLVQPDPFSSVAIGAGGRASLVGTDQALLLQRKNFLRANSLLAVIVVTDENEEVANPVSVGGQGWLYEESSWPNSPTAANGVGGAPEGTIECQTNPLDPNCTSCAFNSVAPPGGSAAAYPARCPADPPQTAHGYLDPSDDYVNVRFFQQKRRFGVFAGYPVERYIRGLTRATVPDRQHEADGNGNYVGDQDQFANCVNPIYAINLPDGTDTSSKALCNLTRGPRTADLVYYAAIAGVPHQLLQAQAGVDLECPAGANQADCPQKNTLTDADWLLITGKEPEKYDFTGADFHMLESELPRSQSACPPNSSDTCDPINGREWNTSKTDLQFACTFKFAAPKDCTLPQFLGACDCADGPMPPFNASGKPLCQKNGGNYSGTQVYGKAYPSVREMVIAHAMANQSSVQGIVSSMCPIHTTESGAGDPVFGYRPAVNAIVNRLKSSLQVQCLPQKLTPKPDGTVPCLVLVTLPVMNGTEADCNNKPGLSAPDPTVLAHFQAGQHADWLNSCGGNPSCVVQDQSKFPTCQLAELTPASNMGKDFQGGDCSASPEAGWCYVEGSAAGSCPQQLLFTTNEPPQGSQVNLQCIEQAAGAGIGDGG